MSEYEQTNHALIQRMTFVKNFGADVDLYDSRALALKISELAIGMGIWERIKDLLDTLVAYNIIHRWKELPDGVGLSMNDGSLKAIQYKPLSRGWRLPDLPPRLVQRGPISLLKPTGFTPFVSPGSFTTEYLPQHFQLISEMVSYNCQPSDKPQSYYIGLSGGLYLPLPTHPQDLGALKVCDMCANQFACLGKNGEARLTMDDLND